MNTIADVNRRFRVTDSDRVLGISSFGFDLSVWDIFGTFMAGGALVLPDKDEAVSAATCALLVRTHGVTIWNSVPALFGLVLDSAPDNLRSAAPRDAQRRLDPATPPGPRARPDPEHHGDVAWRRDGGFDLVDLRANDAS